MTFLGHGFDSRHLHTSPAYGGASCGQLLVQILGPSGAVERLVENVPEWSARLDEHHSHLVG